MMTTNSLKASIRFEEGADEIARVGDGRWGSMFIDYEDWEVGSFKCVICGYKSVQEDKTHAHIDDEHETREKLQHLAERLNIDDDSRIDRFRKTMDYMERYDLEWSHKLTEAQKNTPIEETEESPYAEPGLDAAPGY